MIRDTIKLRVRYAETDQMGFVYYGHYAQYLEIARVAVLKKIGVSYRELEEQGFLLPVSTYSIDYLKAAKYDDELLVTATIEQLPSNRVEFNYEVHREDTLLATAFTRLIFMDANGRACRPPKDFLDQLKPFFS